MAEQFDRVAARYEAQLEQGIGVSGESSDWFARNRMLHTAEWVSKLGVTARSVLDYGCGVGTASPHIAEVFPGSARTGVDLSTDSIVLARTRHPGTRFETVPEFRPSAAFDLVYCNGVFHHIPPRERAAAMATIAASLRPGAIFALWENNPWSPAARYVMSRIPFDRDAVLVWPSGARALARAAGLEVVATRFHFIFPRMFAALRPVERALSRVPLGAQYVVVARKPAAGAAKHAGNDAQVR